MQVRVLSCPPNNLEGAYQIMSQRNYSEYDHNHAIFMMEADKLLLTIRNLANEYRLKLGVNSLLDPAYSFEVGTLSGRIHGLLNLYFCLDVFSEYDDEASLLYEKINNEWTYLLTKYVGGGCEQTN